MLCIDRDRDQNPIVDWWVGNPVPEVGRVVRFDADGHELQLILLAMQRGYVGPGGKVEIMTQEDWGYTQPGGKGTPILSAEFARECAAVLRKGRIK